MREKQSNPHSDDDYVDPPPPKKGFSTLFWLIFGAVGLACIGVVFLYMERVDRTRAQAVLAEIEAREFERREKEKAQLQEDELVALRELALTLIQSRLNSIRDEGNWTFTGEPPRFVLTAGKNPLPENLLKALLGPGRSASRIEGRWGLGKEWKLILTEIVGDGKAGLKEARLDISTAGKLRINIGGEQYMIDRFNEVKKN
jgi:hypothetical protein